VAGGQPSHRRRLDLGRRDAAIVNDTAGVVIGGPGFALSDQSILAAEIVVELVAGGNASVLTEEIRSRRGLSYDISGGVGGFRETGSWRIAIFTAPEHREQVVELATGLVTDAVRRGWTQEQVSRASRRLSGLARVETESSLEEALLFGDHAHVGESPGFSLGSHLAGLTAVTAHHVNEAAEFMTDRLVVATAGAG
jgi:predicted Zn-dependent peptidase